MTTARVSTARNRHSDVDTGTDVNGTKLVNVFKFFFFFIGLVYAITAIIKSTEEDLDSLPGVNLVLAQTLSLYFYKSVIMMVLTTGQISQSGINVGLSLDISIEFFKEAAGAVKEKNIAMFLYGSNTKNAAQVFGALFGIGSAISFMSFKHARFNLPFGAEKNVPPSLMDMGAPFLVGGACSNTAAYSIDGLREIIYAMMVLTNLLGPLLVRLTPCPTFNLDGYNPDLDITFSNFFKLLGAIIGLGFAINGSSRLTEEDIQFPYVTHDTAAFFPLGFYNFVSPFFICGLIVNYFFHFGLALDMLVTLIKTFPTGGSAQDFKDWCMVKDAAHVIGMLFGIGLWSAYIYKDINHANTEFIFPSNAQEGASELLMQMIMFIFLSGAYANRFSFFIDALRQAVRGGKVFTHAVRKTAESVLPFSIFGKSHPAPSVAPPPLPVVMPPIPIPPYATPGALYRKA